MKTPEAPETPCQKRHLQPSIATDPCFIAALRRVFMRSHWDIEIDTAIESSIALTYLGLHVYPLGRRESREENQVVVIVARETKETVGTELKLCRHPKARIPATPERLKPSLMHACMHARACVTEW